ncbi:hypothetical protein D3C77_555310 [compost metagenome]
MFVHRSTLQEPLRRYVPFEVAEQPGDVLVARAIEIGFGGDGIVAVAGATDQSERVAHAQRVLDFHVEAGFAAVGVEQAATVGARSERCIVVRQLCGQRCLLERVRYGFWSLLR